MSRPRYDRGRRTCSPTEIVTSRPARRSSSAICTPDADAPTTSTRRRSSTCDGRRYDSAVSCSHAGREVGGEVREARLARPARGGDHGIATPGPVAGAHVEAGARVAGGSDRDPRPHRRVEGPAVRLQRGHRLGRGHVPVGVGAPVARPGQRGHPVGGEEAQRVPALGAPRVRHLAPFEQHVVDTGPGAGNGSSPTRRGRPRRRRPQCARHHAPSWGRVVRRP